MICPLIVKRSSLRADIVFARSETNIHPTEKQIEAGNYKKGTLRWNGLTIKIENPKGSIRSGTSPNGKKWSIKMKHDYGYLTEAKSSDREGMDIFIGDHLESQIVYVIDQMFNGKFDEHKCVIGALDEEEARKTYLANYEKGWKGLGQIKALAVEQFKEWVKDGNTRRAINKQKLFKVGAFLYNGRITQFLPQELLRDLAKGVRKKYKIATECPTIIKTSYARIRSRYNIIREAIAKTKYKPKKEHLRNVYKQIRMKNIAIRRINSKEISSEHFNKVIKSLSKLK